MENVIEVRALTKTFGKFKALDNVNLRVKSGEIHGFIGPNGAGKSTTIHVLLGMLKADSGQATIFGEDAWDDAVRIHQQVSYVPGDSNLWPNLTGGQTIDMLVKMHGHKLDVERKEALIRRFDLDPTKKNRTYSKGNRQKVVLIAAFAVDVDLYILDEPTSGLDPLMERVFQELVYEVKEQGKSVLLSSHILSEVERLCDSVSIIREGQIIESGSLEEMRHLTRNNVRVETERAVTAQNIPGVYDFVEVGENQYQMQISQESLGDVMRYFSSLGLVNLEIQPPTLEDLFLHHYEEGGGAGE